MQCPQISQKSPLFAVKWGKNVFFFFVTWGLGPKGPLFGESCTSLKKILAWNLLLGCEERVSDIQFQTPQGIVMGCLATIPSET